MNQNQLKALEYWDEGYSVFPLKISYNNGDKKLSFVNGSWKKYQEKRMSEEEVERAFSDPTLSIGIVTGKISNLTVIDIDKNEQGKLNANPSDFPDTHTVETQSGGVHLYYKYTDNIKQTQNLKVPNIGEVDIRSDGGFVVAPNGDDRYNTKDNQQPIDAPDHLFQTQSPSGTFKHTTIDDVIYVSEHPELHSRNITVFNYFLTELKQTATADEFQGIYENLVFATNDIQSREKIDNIKKTFESAKKIILKDREGQSQNDIKKEATKMSASKVKAYFERVEEYFVRENDKYVVYVKGDNIEEIYKWSEKGLYEKQSKTQVKADISTFLKEKNLFQYNKDNFHNEIYNRLITHLSTLPNKRFTEVSEKINVQNGFFDLETRTLIPHSKDIFTVNQLNLAYYPEETEMPIFQKYLDVIEQDSDGLSQMLQELAGYVLQEGNARQVVHFLYGATGDNGKSVFWKILAELLGHNNVSFVKLDSFKSSSDFALEGLADKKLNVSDETNRSYIDSPVYTEATSEGTIKLNKKHGGMYDYTVKANFIIVGNFYPKFKDATGMQRRVVVVPFNHKLKPEEKILNIERRIAEKELSAIFNWALKGILMESNSFFLSEQSKAGTLEFEAIINPVKDFVETSCIYDEDAWISPKELYGNTEFRSETGYNLFIKENNKKPLDFRNFSSEFRTLTQQHKLPGYVEWGVVKKVDGKTMRGVKGIKLLAEYNGEVNF